MINLTLLENPVPARLPEMYSALKDKKLLVTGAAGFIGGALFKRLVEYGLDVTGTVLYQEELAQLKEHGYQVEKLDLAAEEDWRPILKDVDIVFNIAALFQEV